MNQTISGVIISVVIISVIILRENDPATINSMASNPSQASEPSTASNPISIPSSASATDRSSPLSQGFMQEIPLICKSIIFAIIYSGRIYKVPITKKNSRIYHIFPENQKPREDYGNTNKQTGENGLFPLLSRSYSKWKRPVQCIEQWTGRSTWKYNVIEPKTSSTGNPDPGFFFFYLPNPSVC
ncbi:hypothetical protein SAMN05444955_10619 [Lihuaxuella thermophila]|uniref:Uncharacterized protein n=1 Tax=Lihuaxuella thermophila TaxID=1173111 RepID=A0A1H8DWS3_9BACL|nr:hypothetical protein SAMN05444955_10619 [Lihuaxuella thermophila]